MLVLGGPQKCRIFSGLHFKADKALKGMLRSRHTFWQWEGTEPSSGHMPSSPGFLEQLRKKTKSPRPWLTGRWNFWGHSVPSLSWLPVILWECGQVRPGDSVGHRGPCPSAGASDRKLRQDFDWGRFPMFSQQALHGGPYAMMVGSPLTSCSTGLKSCCPTAVCSWDWRSHSPPLTSGLHSLYQPFAQDGKVLQDRFYIGHHHQLPTLRHHHAALCAGGLEGLGLEACGLPEDTDHLSTMLVIEKRGPGPRRPP